MRAGKSWVFWAALFIPLALASASNTSGAVLSNVLRRQRIRRDGSGDGDFGADRGDHIHEGVDLLASPGETVYSPVDGRFVRVGYPYRDDHSFKEVVIDGEGYEVKLMYVLPYAGLSPGDPVRRGDVVGFAQDVVERYGPPMLAHVHVEVRSDALGLLDPAGVFDIEQPS